MRDDKHKWPAALGSDRPALSRRHVNAEIINIHRQTVLSGNVADCLKLCGLANAVGGGTDVASGEGYALRQRRDRIVLVNGDTLADGWHADANVAVSDMSAAYAVVSLSGQGAENVISTGTEFYPEMVSPSVSRIWHGFGVLLYRFESPNSYRLHIRTAQLEALWEMLVRQISGLSPLWENEAPSNPVVQATGHSTSTMSKPDNDRSRN